MSEITSSPDTDATPSAVNRLAGQRVLVLGLGQTGLAMARWCVRGGAEVVVVDTREDPPQREALRQDVPTASFVCAAMQAGLVDGERYTAVFKSPGLAPVDVAGVVDAARARGLWVGGELSLFALALAELQQNQAYQPRVLAVTGTNGKTTVTSLTGQLVERAGKRVAVAGNIGPSMLDTLGHAIDSQTLPEVWVLELSSFQLADASGFEPTAATVLNITQDHLDWHGSMADYVAAKTQVFGRAGLLLLNRDDAQVMAMRDALAVTPGAPTGRGRAPRVQPRAYQTFGAAMPLRPGDFGIEEVNGMTWLVRALEADETRQTRRAPADEVPELHFQRLMPADALRIRGRHNAVNALAALALASHAGCSLAPMLYGLREYRGEPHRMESVGVLREVEYFDDSKGTNVGATVAALNGLGADRRVLLILGGEGKGQDFSALADPVARYARAVVLIGRDAPLIEAALAALDTPRLQAATLEQAVLLASQRAQAGDAVLLSPACASFDMFKNYGHRAEVFVQAVHALATEAGVTLESLG